MRSLKQYYDVKVVPSKSDVKASKARVRSLLDDALRSINDPIYSFNFQYAGSVSTNTKVNKADEFDFELPLNMSNFRISEINPIFYRFEPDSPSLNINKATVMDISNLPRGYVQVVAPHAPANLRFGVFLAPRLIHEDLYQKLRYKGFPPHPRPHGPALTFTVSNRNSHNIDVDLVPSLYDKTTVKVSREVWQRPFFRRCLPSLVDELKQVPILLVPKRENAWLVSYEKLVKKMLNKLDTYGTCRKYCHKMWKYDFLQMKSVESFEGISTYQFKHHLLWFNDKHPDDEYWNLRNFKRCYVEMLLDLAECLENGSIPNYFDATCNQLVGKKWKVVNRLAFNLYLRVIEVEITFT